MVSISHETPEQTDARLRSVLAAAAWVVHDGAWCFREAGLAEPPPLGLDVLAAVRDEDSWSWLTRAAPEDPEPFGLVSFHFPPGVDNSGFVGWLAQHFKRELGTGVFVVCGQNSRRGGIYDYWGYPIELQQEVIGAIEHLGATRG